METIDFVEEEQEIEAGETYTPKEKESEFKFPVLLDDDLIEEETIEDKIEEKPKRRETRVQEERNIPDYAEKVEDRDLPYNNSYTRDLNSADYSLHDRKTESKGFKPSPIISPIYGVLDKNYTKDEIHEKKETHTTTFSFSNDKLDLDTVRRKAYGENGIEDYEQDIQTDLEEDSQDEYTEEDTSLDMTDTNMTPVVEKVTVGDAEEYFADLGLEYNVDYKDNSKEKSTRKRSRRIQEEEPEKSEEEDTSLEEKKEEIETEKTNENPVEGSKKTRSRKAQEKEDIEIEDNLFDLIDSMYDEGE